MLELLIAILISLGCYVKPGTTAEEIRATNPAEMQRAESIYNSGSYEKTSDGGVVIVTVVGD